MVLKIALQKRSYHVQKLIHVHDGGALHGEALAEPLDEQLPSGPVLLLVLLPEPETRLGVEGHLLDGAHFRPESHEEPKEVDALRRGFRTRHAVDCQEHE